MVVPAAARGSASPLAQRPVAAGLAGAIIDLVLAAVLTAFLLVATAPSWQADAVPRPLVLGALFATPGVVGLVGAYARRPSLLIGAAIPLAVSAFLSLAFVTLPFLVPSLLLLIGAAMARRGAVTVGDVVVGGAVATVIAGLIIIGGWAALFGFTEQRCAPVPDGSICSSSAIALDGVMVGGACLAAAVAVSIWSARR